MPDAKERDGLDKATRELVRQWDQLRERGSVIVFILLMDRLGLNSLCCRRVFSSLFMLIMATRGCSGPYSYFARSTIDPICTQM